MEWDPARAAEYGKEFTSHEWTQLHTLLKQQRVAGIAAWRISRQAHLDWPEEIKERLLRQYHKNKIRALKSIQEYRAIHQALAQEGVEVIPLKGIDLIQHLYPDPGMRSFEDIDLLIREKDLKTVIDIMQKRGYEIPKALAPVSLLRLFHFHLPFIQKQSGHIVEIHWMLTDRHTLTPSVLDGIWNRSVANAKPALSPGLYAVYLAIHMAKHGYLNNRLARHEDAKWLVLHPLTDLRADLGYRSFLWMKQHQLSTEQVLQEARHWDCEPSVQEAFTLCAVFFERWEGACSPLPITREGLLERYIKNRIMERIDNRTAAPASSDNPLPWFLNINKHVHVRPIRLFGGMTQKH